jgi:hypothetical protein
MCLLNKQKASYKVSTSKEINKDNNNNNNNNNMEDDGSSGNVSN